MRGPPEAIFEVDGSDATRVLSAVSHAKLDDHEKVTSFWWIKFSPADGFFAPVGAAGLDPDMPVPLQTGEPPLAERTVSRAARVGLLIPLAEEYLAIEQVLPANRSFELGDEVVYELRTPNGHPVLTAVVGDMGQEHAAIVAERLIATANIDLLAVVGIAGSLNDRMGLGDVVIPTLTDLYGSRAKAVPAPVGAGHELMLAGEPFRTEQRLVGAVRQLHMRPELRAAWNDWLERTEVRKHRLGLGSPEALAWGNTPTRVELGHVASGNEVAASAAFVEWLRKRDRSYLAIEMEAGGVSVSAHRRLAAHPVLVIRGISDLADERKEQVEAESRAWPARAWRTLAAQNAADLLATLIDTGLLQLPAAPAAIDTTTPIDNLPPPADRELTGRQDDLRRVGSGLKSGPVSITGLGGMGKSRLALEVARSGRLSRPMTWWVRAERPLQATADLVAAAGKLGLADVTTSTSDALEALRRWCGSNSGWLFVFDNATDPGLVNPLLPEGDGEVVITSTNPNWLPIAAPVHLQALSTEAAVALLARTGGVPTDEAAHEIAVALGGLPLALVQAGSYVQAAAADWELYREELRHRAPELFAQGRPIDYERTVSTTWSASFDRIEAEQPGAAQLLRILSFVAPDDIPMRLAASAVGGESGDVDAAVTALRRFSLVDRHGSSLSMHRLVQQMTRERVRVRGPQAEGRAAKAVAALAPADFGSTTASDWTPYVRHMTALLSNAGDLQPIALQDVERAIAELRHGRLFSLAVELAEAFVAALQRHRVSDDVVVRGLDALGGAQSEAGDRVAGKLTRERAVELAGESTAGPVAMLELRGNHALAMVDAGDKSAAIAELRDIVKDVEALDEALASQVRAEALHNLGYALFRDGQYEEALEPLLRALEFRKETDGPMSEDIPVHLNMLGMTWLRLGLGDEASDALEQALLIESRLRGERHERVAARASTLGAALLELEQPRRALTLLEQARRISADCLEPTDDKHSLRDLWVAKAQLACGMVSEATATVERALVSLDALPSPPPGRRRRLEELLADIVSGHSDESNHPHPGD